MIENTYQKFRNAGFDHESAMRAETIKASEPKPHTKKASIFNAERICAFLNQRFGYSRALELSLEAHGIQKDMVAVMVKLARNRSIDEFTDLLHMHIKDQP